MKSKIPDNEVYELVKIFTADEVYKFVQEDQFVAESDTIVMETHTTGDQTLDALLLSFNTAQIARCKAMLALREHLRRYKPTESGMAN